MRYSLQMILIVFFAGTTQVYGVTKSACEHNHQRIAQSKNFEIKHQLQRQMQLAKPWQLTTAAQAKWHVRFDERSGFPSRAIGKPINLNSGLSEIQAIEHFVGHDLSSLAIQKEEMKLLAKTNNGKYSYVHYQQTFQGIEVLNSRATFRINSNHQLAMFGFTWFDVDMINLSSFLTDTEIRNFATDALTEAVVGYEAGSIRILPIATADAYDFHLIKEVMVETEGQNGIPAKYLTYVDVHTGEVLYRQNQVRTIDIAVSAEIVDNPLEPAVVRDLAHMRVRLNNQNLFTSDQGILTVANNTNSTGSFFLEGRFTEVIQGNNNTPNSIDQAINDTITSISLTGLAEESELAGYYHVNKIHEHMKEWTPAGFTAMDGQMAIFVDITSGNCNAFYDGNLNFFAAGGGCPATSLFSDVIYHEYGHGINSILYNFLGGQFGNGALGEAYADIWALTLTENPILGRGFTGSANSSVRRYDINPKVYPEDLVGEVHADGEIIAGAWWDLGQMIGIDQMMELFMATHFAVLSEPDGQEGKLFSDILLETLLVDDDNNDLTDGTPHDEEIIQAFADHGITLFLALDIEHEVVEAIPAASSQSILADLSISPVLLGVNNVLLNYRINNDDTYNSVPMSVVAGSEYEASIPAQPKGTLVQYFIEVNDGLGRGITEPERCLDNNPNIPFCALVGFQQKKIEDFDNTSFLGTWEVDPFGFDDASTGIWEIGEPNETFSGGETVQFGEDHTVDGTRCLFTGNSNTQGGGDNDVDDGKTTVISPPLDLTEYVNPAISYFRHYTNNTGVNPETDFWNVYVSNDASNWVRVERTIVSSTDWRKFAFRVKDYVEPSVNTYIMFEAQDSLIAGLDFDGGSLVEAEVDDIIVWDEGEVVSGIEMSDQKDLIEIYPNPASSSASIDLSSFSGRADKLEVLDLGGKVIYSRSVANPIELLDLSTTPNGQYLVRIFNDESQIAELKLQVIH